MYCFSRGFQFSISSLWLQVSLDKGDRKDRDLHEDLWFELSDETLCNWMMFVRPAQNHLEQNLVAYQYGHHVYYTTIKNVEPKQELKVQNWILSSLLARVVIRALFYRRILSWLFCFYWVTSAFLLLPGSLSPTITKKKICGCSSSYESICTEPMSVLPDVSDNF